ncbi:type VII secretion protein EccB [Streptomyces sp. NPDC087532]|uniref:type VII secretion protein EccB n=1 Tax=Streptomyces sp. NPDC087532 TaxID=3365795 RepID=UPI00381E5EA3
MQSRRDQVQAQLFVMSRLSSGMLRADPDTPDAPLARTRRGLIGGALIAVLIAIGTAVYGVISPGGATAWRTPGTLVLVRDSTSRYLYANGVLHPVLNEASAKLIAGSQMRVETVTAASLGSTPHGSPIGIVGAPDSVPGAASLDSGAWLACGGRASDGHGGKREVLSVSVGRPEVGRELSDGDGILVSAPSGGVQLLWKGMRHRLDTANGAHSALGWAGSSPMPVSDAFLNTLTAGTDVTSPDVAGRGEPGPELASGETAYGQLFEGPAGQHYLLRKDGLVPLTPLLFDLLRGDPRTQDKAYGGGIVKVRSIGPAELAAHQASKQVEFALAEGLPSTPPQLVAPHEDQEVCAKVTPHGSTPSTSVTVVDSAEVPAGAPDNQPGVQASCLQSDRIWVRPGSGVLVRALSSSGSGSSQYLVTDAGVVHPLFPDAVKQLGYERAQSVAVPAQWIQLLPTGPSLDPASLARGGVVQAAKSSTPCPGSGSNS